MPKAEDFTYNPDKTFCVSSHFFLTSLATVYHIVLGRGGKSEIEIMNYWVPKTFAKIVVHVHETNLNAKLFIFKC